MVQSCSQGLTSHCVLLPAVRGRSLLPSDPGALYHRWKRKAKVDAGELASIAGERLLLFLSGDARLYPPLARERWLARLVTWGLICYNSPHGSLAR